MWKLFGIRLLREKCRIIGKSSGNRKSEKPDK